MRNRKHRKQTVDVPYTSALIYASDAPPLVKAELGELLLWIADLPEVPEAL